MLYAAEWNTIIPWSFTENRLYFQVLLRWESLFKGSGYTLKTRCHFFAKNSQKLEPLWKDNTELSIYCSGCSIGMGLLRNYHSRRQIESYILPCCAIVMDLLVRRGLFGSQKWSKCLFSTMMFTKHLIQERRTGYGRCGRCRTRFPRKVINSAFSSIFV